MASPNMQQPILATVVAVELAPQGVAQPLAARVDALAHLLVSSIAQSCSVQRQSRPDATDGLTLVLPPNAPVGSVLRRATASARLFEGKHLGERVRMLVHHGVVFSAQEGKRESYVGSAIRSAHSILRRLVLERGAAATPEFAQYARDWPDSPLHFVPLEGSAAVEGLLQLSIDEPSADDSARSARQLDKDDSELLRFLVHRLAEDVGPFASVLVENARRSASNVESLLAELAPEIDDMAARQRFVTAAQAYVDSRRA